MPTTPFHSDDANDANCISCITTPQKSPPTQPQKTFPRRTLLPQHVPSLRVPFAGHPPRPPNYSLRSPNTTPLAPSTKAGFRNKFRLHAASPKLGAPAKARPPPTNGSPRNVSPAHHLRQNQVGKNIHWIRSYYYYTCSHVPVPTAESLCPSL